MAPAAARRAAASDVRRLVSTAGSKSTAASPRAAVTHNHPAPCSAAPPSPAAASIRHAATPPQSASTSTHHAGPRAAIPHSAVATNASSSSSLAPTHVARCATPLSAPTTGHLRTASRRFTSIAPYPFKTHRRLKHGMATPNVISEEVQAELHRIESDGLNRHKELQQSILDISKKVVEATANAKAVKVNSTWEMGKTAFKVCSTVLAAATLSGYAVLHFVKFGWGRGSQDAAGQMLEAKISELKEGLEKKMDATLREKEKEKGEAAALSLKTVELDEKAKILDKKEAELKAREAAVAAKEAAAKKPPK